MDFGFPRQFGAVFCKDKTMEVETVTTVELTRKEAFRKLEKCCFCINLRLGLNIWLGVESILWLFLFISALYFEIIYVNEVDLLNFIDETNDWYFLLIFGDRFYSLDQKIRSESEFCGSDMRLSHVIFLAPFSLHHPHQLHVDARFFNLFDLHAHLDLRN